jgi:hypothetical protein
MVVSASRWVKPILVILWVIFCIAIADIGMGILFRDRLVLHQDERNLTYRYDPQLGWFPIPNSKKIFSGNQTIHVEHNARGFRDVEHVLDARPRMLFLGDSFVWGYDVEQPERFTDKLRAKLTDWSIYNLGVSGYGTDQEYLLLKQQYDFYRPQIVFLVFCTDNDDADNAHNVRYGVYYKPYFTVDGASLSLRGVPVPKSENYFFAQHTVLARSNWVRLFARAYFILTAPPDYVAPESPTHAILADMQRFIQSKGGKLIVGLQNSYPELEHFLKEQKIPYVDLTNSYRYPTQSRHWTSEGHNFVSDKIQEFLRNGNYLQAAERKTAD